MAEAVFAIIGTTAAILQLSEFTGKVAYSSYVLYHSTSGQTVANESIENIIVKLGSLLAELRNTHQDHQNVCFSELVKHCQALVGRNTTHTFGEHEVSSEAHLQDMNRNRILKSLRFDGMGERFKDVARSEKNTYNWCLQDAGVPKSHPELKLSFRNWLGGQGVFHIAGKPGAGKSTLMKFIVNHPATERYLLEWADTRRLVMAKNFFWKPGKPLEKSLEGLMRSIVHAILQALPGMVPVIFSQYWNPSNESISQTTADIEMAYD
ncbi:hypothetical protein BKA65DRAFT_574655 [Rhexocercosporidium sp. MPI-PUGE-AT-0058]|nr:hypothetical protein BKA65DRAFT_574655 [Rhexocercosporidium sp. MPI-PUGE-AT-0058]